MNQKWLGAALLGLAVALPASAAHERAGEHQSLSAIAQEYNVEEMEMRSLRDKGWSWNEIGSALAISKRSGKPLQEVVTQRDSGLGWNQIADRYGFRFGEVSKEAKQVARDAKRLDRQDRREGRRDERRGMGTQSPANPERHPHSQGPGYPQNPEGPGDSQQVTPGPSNPQQTLP